MYNIRTVLKPRPRAFDKYKINSQRTRTLHPHSVLSFSASSAKVALFHNLSTAIARKITDCNINVPQLRKEDKNRIALYYRMCIHFYSSLILKADKDLVFPRVRSVMAVPDDSFSSEIRKPVCCILVNYLSFFSVVTKSLFSFFKLDCFFTI